MLKISIPFAYIVQYIEFIGRGVSKDNYIFYNSERAMLLSLEGAHT